MTHPSGPAGGGPTGGAGTGPGRQARRPRPRTRIVTAVDAAAYYALAATERVIDFGRAFGRAAIGAARLAAVLARR